jgi:hypothetical protein
VARLAVSPRGWPGRNRGEMSDVNAVRAAQDQGQRDAQHRMDYYSARPGLGVPAGSTGEPENRPLALPDDPAVTGTGGGR